MAVEIRGWAVVSRDWMTCAGVHLGAAYPDQFPKPRGGGGVGVGRGRRPATAQVARVTFLNPGGWGGGGNRIFKLCIGPISVFS